jgi:hypothetical protein
LVGKPNGERPLGRPRCRWVNKIRMYLVGMGWGDVDWIGLAQNKENWIARSNVKMDLRVSTKCWETLEWLHTCWALD